MKFLQELVTSVNGCLYLDDILEFLLTRNSEYSAHFYPSQSSSYSYFHKSNRRFRNKFDI